MTSYASNHSTGDTQYNVRDAALHGATLAFSKPPAKPKPQVNTYTGGDNGALLAATKVGSPRGSPAPLTKDWTGSRSVSSVSSVQTGSKANSNYTLGVPEDRADRTSSPSNIAARLAAARYSPLRPMPQAANAPVMSERHANERDMLPPSGSVGSVLARLETTTPRQQAQGTRASPGPQSVVTSAVPKQRYKPVDFTPIPTAPRGQTFNQSRSTTPPKPPLNTAQHSPPPVRSPKPQRAFKLPPEPSNEPPLVRQRTRTPPRVKPKPKHQIELAPSHFTDGATYFHTPQKDPMKSPPIKQKPPQMAPVKTSAPMPPPQRGSRETRPKSEDVKASASARRRMSTVGSEQGPPSPASFKSAKEVQEEEEKLKPSLPPPRRSTTRKPDGPPTASRPRSAAPIPIAPRNQSQAPNPMRSPTHLSPPRRPTSTSSISLGGSVYHNNYQRDSVRQITKHMTGESLSSAIMGAALASSRNGSPAPAHPLPIEPLFPPRRSHHHHHSPFRRSPSPPKQSPPKSAGKMRTTMRKEPSSSDDEDEVERYKKKGTRIMGIKGRKHPNKHHEGTRKRWRDQLTERERKRYDGVWAANKGLYLPAALEPGDDEDPAQDVLNLAVLDIWTRSRLPVHVLEEVWDLVDSRALGRLKRVEFVVGLWLIDQRLKGRKLPIRVSESVWTSARGVGIKVKVRG
jgi:hypothetical protein